MATQPIPIPGAQSLQTLVAQLRAKTLFVGNPDGVAQLIREKDELLRELDGVPGRPVRESDRAVIQRLLNS